MDSDGVVELVTSILTQLTNVGPIMPVWALAMGLLTVGLFYVAWRMAKDADSEDGEYTVE